MVFKINLMEGDEVESTDDHDEVFRHSIKKAKIISIHPLFGNKAAILSLKKNLLVI